MKNTTDKTILVPLISDGPNTGFKSVPNPDYVGPQKSPSPSYTLADLEQLTKQWATENNVLGTDQWLVSCWLAWLGRKEREANGN